MIRFGKYLLEESPLVVLPNLAVSIGLNEAIILQQVQYWVRLNERMNRNYRGGYFWTYNTYEEWGAQFPFWSIRTIKRCIGRLEEVGLLVSEFLDEDWSNRTKWYRIDYDKLWEVVFHRNAVGVVSDPYNDSDKMSQCHSDKMTQSLETVGEEGFRQLMEMEMLGRLKRGRKVIS